VRFFDLERYYSYARPSFPSPAAGEGLGQGANAGAIMNYTLKLAIPLGLGLAAAVVNMMVLTARTNSVTFIKAKRDVQLGQPFSLEDLAELPLPGAEAALLKDTAMPYADIGVLVGQPALRDFMAGDIVFYRDFPLRGDELQLAPDEVAQQIALDGLNVPSKILRIGYELDFLVQLGPQERKWIRSLRLVSVGDRVSDSIDRTASGGANVVMVAVKRDPKLKEDIDRQMLLEEFALKRQQESAQLLDVRISPEFKPVNTEKSVDEDARPITAEPNAATVKASN
jgi:hypothetical protein